jgi:hypothetical protein
MGIRPFNDGLERERSEYMKSWLAKFRISTALDSGKPLPESLRRNIAADPELERFTRRTETLGQALRRPPPTGPSMHDSIMRAVRAAARPAPARRSPVAAWLVATTALAGLALAFLLTADHRQTTLRGTSMDGAVTVLEMSEHIPNTIPSFVMSPLSNEWARVDRNLQDTKQVLLASLP